MANGSVQLPPDEISAAFLEACEAELQALKPGNVHIFEPGHNMDVTHFRKAANAAAIFIADPSLSVGQKVKGAVSASMDAAKCNTNLGIVLLCAPLAASVERPSKTNAPQGRLTEILQSLSPQDADDVFAAIRCANPGGLGGAAQSDVHDPNARKDLLHAMGLSAHFDRIARAYATNFDDVFNHHLPVLRRAAHTRASFTSTSPQVVTMLFMAILAEYPDSHIIRKFGLETAQRIQRRAGALRPLWDWETADEAMPVAHPDLLSFDQDLKAEGLNPGTTADFVVATLFAERIFRRFDAH